MIAAAFLAGLVVGALTLYAGGAALGRRRIRRLAVEYRYNLRTNGRGPGRNRPRPLSGA